MKRIVLLISFFLTACANDQYVATTGNPSLLSQALSSCKSQVLHDYAQSRSRVNAAGAIAGGLGALIADDGTAMQPGDINPAIERCMAARGFAGTSAN